MNTRLKQFIEAENISQAEFADKLKVVRASVSHIIAGRNKPSYEFIRSLILHYPQLNMEWLMLGKGKLYKQTATTEEEKNDSPDNDEGVLLSFEQEPSSQPSDNTEENIQSSFDINTLIEPMQKPVKQRKVVKVAVFFDDGTYQEL